MLDLSASTGGTTTLPGRRPIVYAFLSDLPRLVDFLGPDVQAVGMVEPERVRVRYRTEELGFYPVEMLIDLDLETHPDARLLRLRSTERPPEVVAEVGPHGVRARGRLDLEVRFTDAGPNTRIAYTLTVGARVPRPAALAFVPEAWITGLAERLAAERLETMTEALFRKTKESLANP